MEGLEPAMVIAATGFARPRNESHVGMQRGEGGVVGSGCSGHGFQQAIQVNAGLDAVLQELRHDCK